MHIILDFYDASRDVCLDDKRPLETVTQAAKSKNATIITRLVTTLATILLPHAPCS
jgi:S-adenosylmethionine/arginine decarboxylase-like enzyme